MQRAHGRDAIALDTKGPEIRTGQLARGSPAGDPGFTLAVRAGDELVFTTDPSVAAAGGAERVYVDYADIDVT